MWRAVSLVMAIAAIVGVFAVIPIISGYAFWFLVAAVIVWLGVHTVKRPGLPTMAPIALFLVAVVGVFVEIPVVSDYAFWVLAVDYIYLVSISGA
jgi:hypothetical protein